MRGKIDWNLNWSQRAEFADKMLYNSLIVRASQIKCALEQVAQMFCLGTSTHCYMKN